MKRFLLILLFIFIILISCAGNVEETTKGEDDEMEIIAEPKVVYRIAYSQFRTNLESRQTNLSTTRSYIVEITDDGFIHAPYEIVPELKFEGNKEWSVQFSGWYTDNEILFGRGFVDEENALEEERQRTFLFGDGKRILHTWRYNLDTKEAIDLAAIEQVSDYCTGFYRSGDRLIFSALIGNNQVTYTCALDGTDKRPLSDETRGYTYTPIVSEDGITIRQTDYKIYIDYPDGTTKFIDAKQNFNFAPQRSPDGKYLTFVAGKDNMSSWTLYVVGIDGENLREIADRGTEHKYECAILFLDVYDYHGGSSDVPVWSPNKNEHVIYFTRKDNPNGTNIYKIDIDTGIETQLTNTGDGVLNYQPNLSPDGEWISFGSTRTGTRQLYIMRPDGSELTQISQTPVNNAAMWANWHKSGN